MKWVLLSALTLLVGHVKGRCTVNSLIQLWWPDQTWITCRQSPVKQELCVLCFERLSILGLQGAIQIIYYYYCCVCSGSERSGQVWCSVWGASTECSRLAWTVSLSASLFCLSCITLAYHIIIYVSLVSNCSQTKFLRILQTDQMTCF